VQDAAVPASTWQSWCWFLLAIVSAFFGVGLLVLGIAVLLSGEYTAIFALPWVIFWYWIGVGAWRRGRSPRANVIAP
jgi:hypothetical protein